MPKISEMESGGSTLKSKYFSGTYVNDIKAIFVATHWMPINAYSGLHMMRGNVNGETPVHHGQSDISSFHLARWKKW